MHAGDLPPVVNAATGEIVDAAIQVHRVLGPGLLERAYQFCLTREPRKRGRRVDEQVLAPLVYDGARLDAGFRVDLIVDTCVLVEVKAVEASHPTHFAQVYTYLKLTNAPVGFLINFHERRAVDGLHRLLPPSRLQ